jgi:hypothetical protein
LLIADAIKFQLQQHEGRIAKAARTMKLAKVSVFGSLTLDLSQPGLPPDVTLTDVLVERHRVSGKPVVLIVDEAQHALLSGPGITTMFTLKAARDRLNTSSSAPQLMLVLTGSNRDKLAHLVLHRPQPFSGSSITYIEYPKDSGCRGILDVYRQLPRGSKRAEGKNLGII